MRTYAHQKMDLMGQRSHHPSQVRQCAAYNASSEVQKLINHFEVAEGGAEEPLL